MRNSGHKEHGKDNEIETRHDVVVTHDDPAHTDAKEDEFKILLVHVVSKLPEGVSARL